MSNKKTVVEKVLEAIRRDPKTYLEVGEEIYGEKFNENPKQKGYIKVVFHKLMKRGLIEPTQERRQRCCVYKAKASGNMLFIKDDDLNALEKGCHDFYNLFEEVSDRNNIKKILKGDFPLFQELIKNNIDFSVFNMLKKKFSQE